MPTVNPVKLLRLLLCAVIAASIVVVVPRDAGFGVMIVSVLVVAFTAGAVGGSRLAMPLTPIAMFVGGLIEEAVGDFPETEDEIPAIFTVLFYVFAFLVLAVWAGIGVLAEHLLRKRLGRNSA